MEWFYIMVSLSCFFSVAYTKLNWPAESLGVLMLVMIYPTIQLLKAFKVIDFKRFKWSLNMLQLQQKKIRNLKTEIDTLKSDNQLLVDEITGLHKIWMNQSSGETMKMPKTSSTTKVESNQETKITDIVPIAQLEYTASVELSEILKSEKVEAEVEVDQWQETASIDKAPF